MYLKNASKCTTNNTFTLVRLNKVSFISIITWAKGQDADSESLNMWIMTKFIKQKNHCGRD